ncbi:elicitin [Phytophthora sojae]|uniref:Elicitin n=2 Tax=Phytophthora sojae TaxID=67593 RepID=G4YKS9_PHYSP|nr:elicitin [Phytophthora sojae]ABB56003.1 elicitin-like protein SOL11A [Phytophthora sojae]EGZ29233.1 elicitin [Phytophthora sojae]|eukprot:XP_009516508.1 elicitin [Phytophthora sojae]
MVSPHFALAVASTLLVASTVSADDECSASVSESVIVKIDNSSYYDTCAVADEGADVTFNVSTLFDVLNFTESEFILFCNSSTCLEPVHEMVHSIPTDCLILYEGTERNLSEEVTALHDECHKALGTDDDDDDTTDSDDMSMSMTMSMSGMDMGGTSSSSKASSSSSAASTVTNAFVAAAVAGCATLAALL